jgi:UrcA family protein
MSASTRVRAAGPRAKFALLVLGSFGGVMAAGAASAASSDDDVPRVVLEYSAQSLETDEGVHALYRRITLAAKQVCPEPSIRNLGLLAKTEQCRNHAIAGAIQQIDNSRLAALHAVRFKHG